MGGTDYAPLKEVTHARKVVGVNGTKGKEDRMKVVITGASGSVGTSLLARAKHHDITAIARRAPVEDSSFRAYVNWACVELGAPGTERRLTELFTGADAVVHLAWAI